MPLKVIGAGFPRTGTLSLKLALERLGFGPCHHMTEVFSHPDSWPHWRKAAEGEELEWEDIFGDFQSCTDAPGCFFWSQLAVRYPDARIVLTERDPESWHRSMSNTILTVTHRDSMLASELGPIIGKISGRGMGVGPLAPAFPPPKEQMIAAFKAHYASVISAVPPERLLRFRAADGWAPLCAFLDAPVPDEPYPRVNNSEEFHSFEIPSQASA